MTSLLKAAAGDTKVRAFAAVAHPAAYPPDPVAEELRHALELVEIARARIGELEAACIAAREEGEEVGRQRGRAEAEDGHSERLKKLDLGISSALAEFGQALSAMEQLASLIARTCVETIIGDPGHHADLVARALERQLKTIEAASIIRVSVSPEDFGEAAELETLAASSGTTIIVDPALASGECRITLRLGSLEIGPVTQWRRLSQLLAPPEDART